MKQIITIACILLIIACGSKKTKSTRNNLDESKIQGENLIEYASGFELYAIEGGFHAIVFHPWKNNEVLASYFFLTNPELHANQIKHNDIVITVPVDRMATMSSTFLGMLGMLDARDVLVAATDPRLIYDSILYHRFEDGKIADLGGGMENQVEAVIGQSPDVLMKYIYLEKEVTDAKISAAGIPIAYNIEFMEAHPLGRAEWLKFTGALLGKYDMADSIFSQIKSNYMNLMALSTNSKERPKVLAGSSFKGTWYMPGGKSFIAKLIQDAGGDYIWGQDSSQGSVPLSFELIIKKQLGAEIWINANALSINELLSVDPRYKVLDAFKQGMVYHYNEKMNVNGGMDYHETGVVRPDLLLEDIIAILHPHLFSGNHKLHYMKILK